MNQLFLLTNGNKILKTTYRSYNLSGAFKINKKMHSVTTNMRGHYGAYYGAVCHQDCFNLIKKKLKYEISYADVCRSSKSSSMRSFKR